MADPAEPPKDLPPAPDAAKPAATDSRGDVTKNAAENAAEIAAAFLDLWQRNIAAWAADPKSGPPLAMIETLAGNWLRKSGGS